MAGIAGPSELFRRPPRTWVQVVLIAAGVAATVVGAIFAVVVVGVSPRPSVATYLVIGVPFLMLALVAGGTRALRRGRFVAAGLMFAPAVATDLSAAWILAAR